MSLDLLPAAGASAPEVDSAAVDSAVAEPTARRALLDVTVARLDLERIVRMGELAAPAEERAEVRVAVIGRISRIDPDGWLACRWYRWARMFGLPRLPAPAPAAPLLLAPYSSVDTAYRRIRPFLDGVLAVFDAGLALAPGVPDGPEPIDALLRGWTGACLPTSLTPEDAYGPRTPEVQEVLRHAGAFSSGARVRAHEARAAISAQAWNAACGVVDQTSTKSGAPFLARHLYGEALSGTADAALAEAVWGAAVATVFRDDLPEETRALLNRPFSAAA